MTFQEKILNLESINLLDYINQFSEFVELENTPQSIKWHSEGSVLIHTNMVMEKALEIALQMKNKDDGISIYLGSLLHDFGKVSTTISKSDGKYSAYGHESVGMWKAREFLRKHFPMFGYARREWILNLVEYHGHPKRMAEDESDDLRFKRLSLEVNTEQVYHVEVADFTGRTGESSNTAFQYLDTFKQRCIDLGIWDTYYELPDSRKIPQNAYNLARWKVLFGNMKETDQRKIDVCIKLMSKPPFELMILVGAPGSGKTTHIKTLYPHVQQISMDDERQQLCGTMMDMSRNQEAYDNGFRQLRKNMEHRVNTIWDATSVSRKLRKRLIEVARNNGALISIVVFDLPLEVIKERNAGRERVVPVNVVEDYYKKIQSPKNYEYDKLLIIDQNTPRVGNL